MTAALHGALYCSVNSTCAKHTVFLKALNSMANCSGVKVDIRDDDGDNELEAIRDSAQDSLHCSRLAYGVRLPCLLNIC